MGDLDAPSTLGKLTLANSGVYYFAPPPNSGTNDTRMANFLAQLTPNNCPQRIVYISTTGVYSKPTPEQWVDENFPTQPTVERGLRRLNAEQQLLAWQKNFPQTTIVILRVVGIYGPDKLPLERIKRGEPLLEPRYPAYVNVIHVDDLVQACYRAMHHAPRSAIYNVSDGHPLLMTEYFQTIADTFNLPQPPLVSLQEAEQKISAGFLSYLQESKRIDNRKMREELGVELRYPTAFEGITAIAKARS